MRLPQDEEEEGKEDESKKEDDEKEEEDKEEDEELIVPPPQQDTLPEEELERIVEIEGDDRDSNAPDKVSIPDPYRRCPYLINTFESENRGVSMTTMTEQDAVLSLMVQLQSLPCSLRFHAYFRQVVSYVP